MAMLPETKAIFERQPAPDLIRNGYRLRVKKTRQKENSSGWSRRFPASLRRMTAEAGDQAA
jgi:hypothetical protein